jgi:hypothetical protein
LAALEDARAGHGPGWGTLMAKYSVTRNGGGHSFGLYRGDSLKRAEEIFDTAPAEKGTVLVLTAHEGPQRVLRRSDQPAIDVCSRCYRPILDDFLPAKDSASGQDVCQRCVTDQRRAHRFAAYL